MWKNINLEACLAHINRHPLSESKGPPENRPAITISRMCGSGGRLVASGLVEYLQPQAPFGRQWTVFDRNLIKKVLEDHSLSARLAEFLPESSKPFLHEMIKQLSGKKLSGSMIIEETIETIWHLAECGYVILVGRGANVITAGLKNIFHVRLVASLENRIKRVEEVYDFDRHAALEYIRSQDTAKRLYLKEYFGKDIDDPQLYHLIVNTDELKPEDATQLIGDTAQNWFQPAVAVNR